MKKLFLFLLLFPSVVFASERYAVERPDGGVSIINYNTNSSDSLEDVIRDLGFDGLPIKKVNDSDIPKDRADRNFWAVIGKKVVVDQTAKQEASTVEAQKQAEKDAILAKLKITSAELDKINGKRNSKLEE